MLTTKSLTLHVKDTSDKDGLLLHIPTDDEGMHCNAPPRCQFQASIQAGDGGGFTLSGVFKAINISFKFFIEMNRQAMQMKYQSYMFYPTSCTKYSSCYVLNQLQFLGGLQLYIEHITTIKVEHGAWIGNHVSLH